MATFCIICLKEDQPDKLVEVKKKGLKTLRRVAKERKLEDLYRNLKQGPTVRVHHDCRRKFVDKRKAPDDNGACRKRLRSSTDTKNQFNWKLHCLFCCKEKDEKRKLSDTSEVETIPIIKNILKQCDERSDDWGNSVRDRLLPSIDIVADEAFYHRACMAIFFKESKTGKTAGRPVDGRMQEIFENLCDWMEGESDCELHLLREVHAKMVEIGGGDPDHCYSSKQLKRKLKDRYKDHLIFIEEDGKSSILCFKNFAWYIMNDFRKKKSPTPSSIILAAAKIIKSELREMPCDKSFRSLN